MFQLCTDLIDVVNTLFFFRNQLIQNLHLFKKIIFNSLLLPGTLNAQYDLDCAESTFKSQPMNL